MVQQQQIFKQKAEGEPAGFCTGADIICTDGKNTYRFYCSKFSNNETSCQNALNIVKGYINPSYPNCTQAAPCSWATSTEIIIPPGGPTPTSAPSTGGGCVSDYCAGPDQCASQGGTTGSQGPRPSGGNCSPNTVMCCITGGGGGGGGGGSQPTAPPLKVCGDTCTTDSQCISRGSGNGPLVGCRNGTCQNLSCIGKTQPGTICSCNTLNACGQPCNATVGLCQTGSTCTYLRGPTCNWGATTYCTPNSNLPTGWTRQNCASGDTGGSYLKNASGNLPTVTEIQTACESPITSSTAPPSTQTTSTATPTPTPTTISTTGSTSTPTMTPTPTTPTSKVVAQATPSTSQPPIPVSGNSNPIIILSALATGLILLASLFLL